MVYEKFEKSKRSQGYGRPVVTLNHELKTYQFNKDASRFFDGIEYVEVLVNEETLKIAFRESEESDPNSYSVTRNGTTNSVKISGLNAISDLGYTRIENWQHKETVPVEKDGELIVADIGAMEPDD